ncbi:hypothetical protein PM082_002334 [Marasmius tenuissimus]|nr:hypothetical protein PM082_002334 [Marasmius tenuissimus]
MPPFHGSSQAPAAAGSSRQSSVLPPDHRVPMPPWGYMDPRYTNMVPSSSSGHQQPFYPYGMVDPRAFQPPGISEENEDSLGGGSGDESSRVMKRKGDEHGHGKDGKRHKNRQ